MLLCGMNFINLIRIRSIFGIEDQLILSYNPKTEKKKESVIGTIMRHQVEDKENQKKRRKQAKKLRDKYLAGIFQRAHRLL